MHHLGHATPAGTAGQLPDALFKRRQRLLGHLAFYFAPTRRPQTVTEELAAKDARHGTFAFVDQKVQLVFLAPQQRHHSLARPHAAHVYVRIIGVAREAMAAPFQFLAHLVEHHVGQQRT